jgi:hypothetical protein
MRAIGVVNAMNLDAGSSLGLHYKGQTLIKPGRWLTNLILVYNDRNRYFDNKEGLAPAVKTARRSTSPAPAAAAAPPAPTPVSTDDISRLTLPLPAFPENH